MILAYVFNRNIRVVDMLATLSRSLKDELQCIVPTLGGGRQMAVSNAVSQ